MAIFGLADLNTLIILKDGAVIPLSPLLKSLPAFPGMSCPQLFQVVDPNASKNCVIVTFQWADQVHIESRKETLEDELHMIVASEETQKLFTEGIEGIRFIGAYHKKHGKVIHLHNTLKAHLDL